MSDTNKTEIPKTDDVSIASNRSVVATAVAKLGRLRGIGERELPQLRRVKFNLVGLTTLGLVAIALPYLLSGVAALVLSGVILAAMALSGLAIWWELRQINGGAAEEKLLREAFNSVLFPQLIVSKSGTIVLANNAFHGWIDISGGGNVVEALRTRFGTTPESLAEFDRVRESLALGQPVMADLPVMRGSRVTEWRRVVARRIDSSGLYHWRFEDISERRRMEKSMRDEQHKLLDFMANAPVGIYSVDQQGRFRFINETLASWLHGTPEDFISSEVKLHDVIVTPTPNGVAPHAIVTGLKGEMRGEVVLRRRSGELFPVEITQTIVRDDNGKTLRTRSIVRDLSPEREWQMALSLSEYRFQRLFAEAPIGIMLLDSRLVVSECNHSFHAIARRPREAIINLPITGLIIASDREDMQRRLGEVLAGADLLKPIEVRIEADREIITQVFVKRFDATNNTPAQWEAAAGEGDVQSSTSGSVERGLMLYFIDSTEQKKLELQFAQSQKMQAIGQLAGGVAHDFNNLLTAMIGFCDLMLQRSRPGDQNFADIVQIKQNGTRAANLVRQLLAFSRQQTLQPQVMNIADILSEISSLLRRLIGPDVVLDVTIGRDLGVVKVDKGQMEQVLINMVVNARDAMPHGGTITVRTLNHQQTDAAMRGQDLMPKGDYVVIHIADHGIGIPPANLQRIFDPFFSTKEIGAGTGLGLSMAYGIIRQTGGFVQVDSVVGKGTTFSIYLPALTAEEARTARAVEVVPEEVTGQDLTGAGTIMLVEDEDAVRIFSCRALRNKGYNVLEARSGEEALAIMEKTGDRVEMIVTDVVMPEMDGPTLYHHIRKRWPNTAVIFVSGYTEDRLREHFTSGETIHFLGKPFTLKQLAGKVKDVMEESRK